MTATAAALHAAGPAAQAIRHTESDLGTWLKEVLDGTGASPAQTATARTKPIMRKLHGAAGLRG